MFLKEKQKPTPRAQKQLVKCLRGSHEDWLTPSTHKRVMNSSTYRQSQPRWILGAQWVTGPSKRLCLQKTRWGPTRWSASKGPRHRGWWPKTQTQDPETNWLSKVALTSTYIPYHVQACVYNFKKKSAQSTAVKLTVKAVIYRLKTAKVENLSVRFWMTWNLFILLLDLFLFIETGSCYIALANLELTILLHHLLPFFYNFYLHNF